MSQVIAIDGQLCEPGAASVSILDRGFLYGDGIFTVLRGRGLRAVDLPGHLEQLAADAAQLGLLLPAAEALHTQVGAAVAAVLAQLSQLPGQRSRLRIVVTRGAGALTARWSELGAARVMVIGEVDAAAPRTEVAAVILEEPRLATSATFAPKSLSYQASLVAREQAAARGAGEGLRLFADDTVGEGATSNLFAVFPAAGGRALLVTPPPLGIRPGVTRRRLLELVAARAGAALSSAAGLAAPAAPVAASLSAASLDVAVRPLARAELAAAAELFVTSSIGGVVPVTSLDGAPRVAGPVTMWARQAYEAFAARAV